MRSKLKFFVMLLPLLVASAASAQALPQAPDAGFWYLLVRWDGPPQKNYYELTRAARFVGPAFLNEKSVRGYKPAPSRIGVDILTDDTVRYGIYQAWKIRVIKMMDSKNTPVSAKDSAYVLIYARNPDWKFAAKKYTVVRTAHGGQSVTYTDLQDGHEYTMELSPDWPRPWTVYEVEVLNENAFLEIWQSPSGSLKAIKR